MSGACRARVLLAVADLRKRIESNRVAAGSRRFAASAGRPERGRRFRVTDRPPGGLMDGQCLPPGAGSGSSTMRARSAVLFLAVPALLVAGTLGGVLRPGRGVADHLHAVPAGHAAHDAHDAAGMDEEAMRRWADAYWATHPRVGPTASPQEILGADATVTVSGTTFDADGNLGTQVDTVRISAGQSVLWQWVNGIHSITSGTGFEDPNAGLAFDQPSDTFNRQFLFTFAQPETVPYFC